MRVEQLTFTRFIAAFAILLFHFAKVDVFPFNLPFINDLVLSGSAGVSYFFILSGFVMSLAYYGRDSINVKKYYINRFARIYPLYFIATLLFILEWVLVRKHLSMIDVVISFLMIQSWIPGKEMILNTPAWSLGVELVFYLLFPFVCKYFLKKYNIKLVSTIIVVFFIVTQLLLFFSVQNAENKDFILYNPLMHLSSFFIGNLGGIYVLKNKAKTKNLDLPVILVASILVFTIYLNNYFFIHNGLLAILIVPLIVLLSLNNGKITTLFSWPKLILLGEISYGFYILQFPIFIALKNILHSSFGVSKGLSFYICTFVLLVISYLFHVFYEKPLQKKLSNENR